ncbi:MAG: replication-associated recombination protein A [Chlamydiales bacterium]|nr:replication-associated recombination protein A [Chlamydiales bacterium]
MIKPLADELRPSCIEDVIGQEHLIGKNGVISKLIKAKKPTSFLLWGPPGCGKTTIGRLYAKAFDAQFFSFSAVFGSIQDLKQQIKEFKSHPLFSQYLVVFVDEIHRFNKAQQDAFLPYVEDGTIILIAATTENPSFALNAALLSRLNVFQLNPLGETDLVSILHKFEEKKRVTLSQDAKMHLCKIAGGDARYLLNTIDQLYSTLHKSQIELKDIESVTYRLPNYDKNGENHYRLISSLHKAVRGSDPDAAIYWLSRMLIAGEDRNFIARRLIRMASEDIGLADPNAISIALSCAKSYEMVGSPEGELFLAEATIYLALAPKSNSCYIAYKKAQAKATETSHLPPPKHIVNAPSSLMKDLEYGKDYQYDHDYPYAFSGQDYLPDELERESFFTPVERGFERELQKRMSFFFELKKKLGNKKTP